MNYIISPDANEILLAISIINGGASIIPDDIDAAVSHLISELGPEAIRYCANMSDKYKRGFLVGWAERLRNSDLDGNKFDQDKMGAHSSFMVAGKDIDYKRGFYIGFSNAGPVDR